MNYCECCKLGLTSSNTSAISIAENMCQNCHTEKGSQKD